MDGKDAQSRHCDKQGGIFTHRIVVEGACTVKDFQDVFTKRMMKVGRFFPKAKNGRIEMLYDAALVWMEPDSYMLTGIERISNGYSIVEFAQSWQVSYQPFTGDDDDRNSPKSYAPPRTPSLEHVG